MSAKAVREHYGKTLLARHLSEHSVRDGGHFTFGGERAFYKFRAAAPRAVLRELGRGSANGGGDVTIWLFYGGFSSSSLELL